MVRRTAIIIAIVLIMIVAFNVAYLQSLPTTRRITVQSYDFFFVVPGLSGNNPTITVRTGDTVVLVLENLGTKNDHEFFTLTQSDFDNYTSALQRGQNATEPAQPLPMDRWRTLQLGRRRQEHLSWDNLERTFTPVLTRWVQIL